MNTLNFYAEKPPFMNISLHKDVTKRQAIGALAVASSSSHSSSIAAGGLIGGAIGLVADALVEDTNYTMITDVRIVEKSKVKFKTVESANLHNGSAGSTNTKLTKMDNKKRYQTRIVSNANKMNLKFSEAEPALVDGLTSSISGVF